jgi:peptidase A4-like protein
MLSKRFAFLPSLAALVVLALVMSAPRFQQTIATPHQHGPIHLTSAPARDGTVTSDNWSGYVAKGTDFTYAKASWKLTALDCAKSPNSYAGLWVGLDGYSSTTVEQTGTASDCNGKNPQYYAWYEFFPAAPVTITSVPISPGNVLFGEVSYNGSEFTLTMTNETTGKTFSKTGKVSGAKRSSAEWIAEAPTGGLGVLPLADFGTESFGDDYTSATDTNWASDNSVTGPISDFGKSVLRINMVNKGVTEAATSVLTTDGSSFKVAWKAE